MRFAAAVLTVAVVVHLYLWHRLFFVTTRTGSRWRWIGAAPITLLGLGLAAALLIRGEYLAAVWTEYLWLAVMFYLVVFLLVLELPRLAAGRRLLLARSMAIVAGLTAVGTTGYGVTQALGAQ